MKVTPQTIRKYKKEGKLTDTIITPGGQTLYSYKEIAAITGMTANQQEQATNEKTAFYLRTSDADSIKADNQFTQLTTKYGQPDKVYKDGASGLNENRPGLKRLIRDAQQGRIQHVIVTQKDRLTRFGYSYLEQLLNAYGCDITIAYDQPDKALQDELMQDFMSLIASFSGKYYRLRGYQQQRAFLDDAEKRFQKKTNNKDDSTDNTE